MKAYIRINSLEDIVQLNNIARTCDYDMVLESGTTQVDPKSIMGIFGIGTNKVVSLVTRQNDKNEFLSKFGGFINHEN